MNFWMRRCCCRSSFPKALSAVGKNSTRQTMPPLNLGPGNGLATLVARDFDRARVRELFEIGLDGTPEQRRLRLAGTSRLASESGVNLGGQFQVQFLDPFVKN